MEATKLFRERGFNQSIIGLTGNSMEEELIDFSNAGADLVLTKPLKTKHLDLLLNYFDTNGVQSPYNVMDSI
jgi:DNA-binding response OmpR family regulator